MLAAVRNVGMDLTTYRQIFTYVQVDERLAERVSVAIEDRFELTDAETAALLPSS